MKKKSFELKVGLAEMLKGGVIMDVTNVCLLYTTDAADE